MQTTIRAIAGVSLILGLAACTANGPYSGSQMSLASPGSSAAAPQSVNSIPAGGMVNAPVAPPTGTVSSAVAYPQPRAY